MRYARVLMACTIILVLGAVAACGGQPGGDTGPTAAPEVIVVTATPGPGEATQPPTEPPPEPTAQPAGGEAEPTAPPEQEPTPTQEGAKGPGKIGGAEPTPSEGPTTATPAETPVGTGAASSLAEVKNAVVQIEAQGTFIDPEFGLQVNAAGSGSGFIVEPTGIAITNNHVVTGAAFLKVWLAGETRPRNAKVIAVSECSDLAVIDIDGEDFPYLEWYDGAVTPGMEIYVAGFPLGDPEYTLTRGIISKERASGESYWASVDYVIEHDARLNLGNSGGPLVTADGKVVGVNFAARADTGQSYAVGRTEFERVFRQLRQGQNVTSIGVNGQVVNTPDVSGVWVASVASGSPADKAGIKAGDIVTQLEGLVLGTDGTMSGYCDVLRSHEPTDTMSITVLRWATGEVLEGQLNGRELEVTQVVSTGGGTGATQSYMTITDDSGALTMDVPTTWSDIWGDYWRDDRGNPLAAMLVAAPDAEAFMDSLDYAGVFFVASRRLAQEYTVDSILDDNVFWGSCRYKGERQYYYDGLYEGVSEEHSGCGSHGRTTVYVAAAKPAEDDFIVWVGIQALTDADIEAANRIVETFEVIGDIP